MMWMPTHVQVTGEHSNFMDYVVSIHPFVQLL